MAIRIRLLGRTEISDGRKTRTPAHHIKRGVLAALAIQKSKFVTFDTMKRWCWDSAPASATPNLRSAISSLRSDLDMIEPGLSRRLTTQRGARGSNGGYRLSMEDCQVDVLEFGSAFQRALNALREGNWSESTRCSNEAERLWGGEFSADLPFTRQVQAYETALHLQLFTVREVRFAAMMLEGSGFEACLPDLNMALSESPNRERLWLIHATAHFLTGDLEEALNSIRRCMHHFDELGLDLPESLRRFQHAALNRDEVTVRSILLETAKS